VGAIFERELKSYFTGVIGYVFAAFTLLFVGIYSMVINLQAGYPYFEYVLSNMTFVYLIAVPILTMRVISEEKRQKTDQLLYALPMSMTKIVLGKYLALLFVLAIPTGIMCLYPLILSSFGTIQLAMTYGVIIAFFLMGAALIAIGLFVSSITENQMVAAVLSFVVLLSNYLLSGGGLTDFIPKTSQASFLAFSILAIAVGLIVRGMTKNTLAGVAFAACCVVGFLLLLFLSPTTMEGLFPAFLGALSIFDKFNAFTGGIFDLTGIVFFLTVIGIGLFLTIQSLEKRRWS